LVVKSQGGKFERVQRRCTHAARLDRSSSTGKRTSTWVAVGLNQPLICAPAAALPEAIRVEVPEVDRATGRHR
jgi:hypothetical protein